MNSCDDRRRIWGSALLVLCVAIGGPQAFGRSPLRRVSLAMPMAGELVVNGDFAGGLNGWTNTSAFFNDNPYNGGIAVVDDGPRFAALRLTGTIGNNYNVRVEQNILVGSLDANFEVSFDWKVTVKEPNWGVNYVLIRFYDTADVVIGKIAYLDTSNPNYTVEYFRNLGGTVPLSAYRHNRLVQAVFDWSHASVIAADLPGMNAGDVRRIHIQIDVQNDSGFGGEMLVDNVSITHGGNVVDCNQNGEPDDFDIEVGNSFDCLGNGVPDECETISPQCPFLPGDVNNDGLVNQNDLVPFSLVLLGLNYCTCSVAAADLNGDDLVDQADYLLFQQVARCHAGLQYRAPARGSRPAYDFLELADELGVELDLGALLIEADAQVADR